jgi:hypothetical protein
MVRGKLSEVPKAQNSFAGREILWRSRDSAVGIATGYGRPRGRSSSPGRVKKFLFSLASRQTLGSTQPHIQWVLAALSPEIKQPVREADHSPPTSTEVKKMWIYTSTPPYAFMA